MTHKPERAKWRKHHKCKPDLEEAERARRPGSRPTLLSAQDTDKLDRYAGHSQRARLISQLITGPEDSLREFTSYFHGPNDLPCLMTSHEKKHQKPVPLYPSLVQQTLKWNPYIDSSAGYGGFIEHEPRVDCQCDECIAFRALAQTSSLNVFKKPFKDNIMKFCDQATMTPKVNDVGCGICLGVKPFPEMRNIDVSATVTAMTAGTDKECSPLRTKSCSRRSRSRTPPVMNRLDYCSKPNKKNAQLECNDLEDYSPNRWPQSCRLQHEAVRDTGFDDYYCKPTRSRSSRSFIKKRSRTPCFMDDYPELDVIEPKETRRMLYNEGISDMVACQYPYASRKQSIQDINARSKASVGKCYPEMDTWIPYSHRSTSKYHHECKRPPSQLYHAETEDIRHVVECQRHARKPCLRRSTSPCRPICITLPKKMLTSEKNIEAFIINGRKYWRADD